jgi:outer membrane cobalamin receptor
MRFAVTSVVCFAAAVAVGQQEPSRTNVVSQSDASSLGALPEMVVTSARLPGEDQPVAKVPANVSVITRDQIQQSTGTSVPEVLARQVGIQNTDTVGYGNDAKPNMRGFGDRTGVLVLVDGVRVNNPGDSTANALWSSIPLQDIDHVEIIRGGGSSIYGEGAIGGVINIITRHDITNAFANITVVRAVLP